MQKILTKREKLILYFIGTIFIFSIAFNFLIAPVLNRYELLNKEIAAGRLRLARYLSLKGKKENIQGKYSKFAAAFKSFSQQQDTYLAVLSELENLAKGANVRIVDIRPQKSLSQGAASYSEITVDLRAEAGIEEYMKFIYDIENSLWLLKIKRLQLVSKPNSQALEGNFSISLISYADKL